MSQDGTQILSVYSNKRCIQIGKNSFDVEKGEGVQPREFNSKVV